MNCGCTTAGMVSGTYPKNPSRPRIRIERRSHRRRGYFRKDGTWVRPTRVKEARFLEADPGKPGRRSRGSKFGPFKKQPKWIRSHGALGGKGYTLKPMRERHRLLAASIAADGLATTRRRLLVLLRPTTTTAKTKRVVMKDLKWLSRRKG